jgi:hypothetical protein
MGKVYGINEFLVRGSEGFGKVHCEGEANVSGTDDANNFF